MKLVPIKSCVLTTGKNAQGETYYSAKLTISLDATSVGVISVAVNKPNALPASWHLGEGVKPAIAKTTFTRYDANLKSFIPASSAGQADRVEALVSLGYAGVKDEDLANFASVRKEVGKKGQNIVHLRRVAEGAIHIERLPLATEEAGVEIPIKG